MAFALTLSPSAITTRELFNEALKGDKWSMQRQMVANVFVELYAQSLTIERLNAIVKFNEGYPIISELDLQSTVTKLVKEKVLRSRMVRGERLYEVNY